jgi:hypothetical protein
MNVLALVFREVLGLFIDDEFLAIAVLTVVGVAAVLSVLLPGWPLVVGGILIVGCVAVLVVSALRAGLKA